MKTFLHNSIALIEKLKWLSQFLLRLVLAYGFLKPGLMKLSNPTAVTAWFKTLGVPFPTLATYLCAGTELAGVILLLLGLFTRLITLPLMFMMVMAIFLVHLKHGFSAGNNGFEIPLYYFLMLFNLLIIGPGKLSIDHIIQRKWIDKN